ncbi:family 10 glycosylhydrolase [candidate division KSB1 bacterium]|nr:family 10 glycosylhydrolase [candidate division KSB1 bacterium]
MKNIKIFNCLLLIFILFSFCKRPKINYDETKEARGIWVTRWEWARDNIKNNPRAQKERIIKIFDLVKKARFNFILFQIRGNGDAFYQSNYEPWSDLLTGKLGKNPGWDPLAFAIEQAQLRGLELHAWINTFPAWLGPSPPPHTNPEHIYNAHPEWIVCDKNGDPMSLNSHYVNLSPGIPAVRNYIHKVCLDIIKNYDIDGFHFDYIRYPEKSHELGYSQDAVSMRLFNSPDGNPKNLKWDDWQRENINKFVRKFYDEATAFKPWLKISAAVIGKYDYSIWNGYHVVYQDALQWIKEEKIDFIAPMIYWQTDHPTAPFGKITKDWLKNYYRARYIFPGMSINKLGTQNWQVDEVLKQTTITRQYGSNGMVFFSFSGLEKAMSLFPNNGFQYLANFPPMSWKDNNPPMDPMNLKAQFLSSTKIKLEWAFLDSSLEPDDVYRYNIYRSLSSPVDITKAGNLIHITTNAQPVYIDNSIKSEHSYYYVVTALDRVNNQSPPSNEVEVYFPSIVERDSSRFVYHSFTKP